MDEHLRALCRNAETTEDKLRCARQLVRAGQAESSLFELAMALLDPANQENDDIWKAITGIKNFSDLETETWREDLDYDQLQIMDYQTSVIFQGIVAFQVFKFLFTDYPQWMDAIRSGLRLTGDNRQKFKQDVWNLVHQLLTWPFHHLDREGRADPVVLGDRSRRRQIIEKYAREIDEWATWIQDRLPEDILYDYDDDVPIKRTASRQKGLELAAAFSTSFTYTLDEEAMQRLLDDKLGGAPLRGFSVLLSGYRLFKITFSNPIIELNRRVGEHILEWIMTGSALQK